MTFDKVDCQISCGLITDSENTTKDSDNLTAKMSRYQDRKALLDEKSSSGVGPDTNTPATESNTFLGESCGGQRLPL